MIGGGLLPQGDLSGLSESQRVQAIETRLRKRGFQVSSLRSVPGGRGQWAVFLRDRKIATYWSADAAHSAADAWRVWWPAGRRLPFEVRQCAY